MPEVPNGAVLRPAGADDADVLADLLVDTFAHYCGAAPDRDAVLAHVRDDVLGAAPSCEVLLIEVGGRVAGFATFAVVYPAPGPSGQLFMKDLFVRDWARGRRLGETVMRHLARLAVARGCSRFDWTAETGNPNALRFYDRLGARRIEEKVYFRFDGPNLRAFADADTDPDG